MKKILVSILTVGVVGISAFAGANAFFSDTETSTGNVLTAGSIDLQIDNTSYKTASSGALVASQATTWTVADLTVQKFFDFADLKPGDVGEDTISLHVTDNDSWLCANVQITENSDNGYSEPEDEMFGTSTDNNDGTVLGDLSEALNFAFWADDGDNVFETGETIFTQGPASNVLNNATLALAQPVGSAMFGNTALTGAQTHYIGKFYCYGTLTEAPAAQGITDPVTRGTTGFTCDGSAVSNLSQTDKLVGDISFYAVQSRNNPSFSCANVVWPTPIPSVGP